MRDPKLFYSIIAGILLMLFLTLFLFSCSNKQYIQTTTENVDTTDVRLVGVDQIQGLKLEIGQKVSIPGLNLEITRISEKEALVKTPVRQQIRTETTLVPTKIISKDRTWNDSFNKDKSKVKEVTRQVEKVKTVDKKIFRFPWWIIILTLVVLSLGWIIKKYGKMILPYPRWPWPW